MVSSSVGSGEGEGEGSSSAGGNGGLVGVCSCVAWLGKILAFHVKTYNVRTCSLSTTR